jgi:WD40 repeat protein
MNLDAPAPPMRSASHANMEYVALSADGKWIATAHRQEATTDVWDALTGRRVKRLPTVGGARIAFSPDNRWLVTGTGAEYRFWKVGTWEPGRRIPQENPKGLPLQIAFSADAGMLAAPIFGRGIRLIEPASGAEIATLWNPMQELPAWLCFSPDGSRLAVAYSTRTIDVWDLRVLRTQLAAMQLDWNSPPFPRSALPAGAKPVTAKIVLNATGKEP